MYSHERMSGFLSCDPILPQTKGHSGQISARRRVAADPTLEKNAEVWYNIGTISAVSRYAKIGGWLMSYISFPGLGIEPFHIDKTAFTLLGRPVAWYGLLITCGMILAVLYAIHIGKFEGISTDDMTDLAFFIIVFGVIGARLYYVIFKFDNYLVTDSGGFFKNLLDTLRNVVAIWEGGLAIYGGIIAGLLTAYLFARKRKIPFLKFFDILAPCVLIGQVIGRWGNFVNMEAYGAETTLPWRMGLLYSYADTGITTGVWDVERYVHPTFLYESLWNLTALVLVLILYKKKRFDGQFFCSYLIWYGFGRMLIEGLRTDSLMLGAFRVSQLVGLSSLILGIVLMVYFVKRHRKNAASEEEYEPIYQKEENVSNDKNNNKEE